MAAVTGWWEEPPIADPVMYPSAALFPSETLYPTED